MVEGKQRSALSPKKWVAPWLAAGTGSKTAAWALSRNRQFTTTGLPVKIDAVPGLDELLKSIRNARRRRVSITRLLHAVWAYAYLQVPRQSITATKSLDEEKRADYLRQPPSKVVGT